MNNSSTDRPPLIAWSFLQMQRNTGSAIRGNKKISQPSACFLQAAAQIGSRMLIFGGCNFGGDPLDQLFLYDTAQYLWNAPKGGDTFQEDHPGSRYGHSATVVEMHPPKLLVYGGMIGAKTYEFESPDTMEFGDTSSKSRLVRNFMQRKRKGVNKEFVEETDVAAYFLTLGSDNWTWSKPMINHRLPRPAGRAEHTAVKISANEVAIFGGWTDRPMNDMWIFNTVNMEWREVHASGIRPKPRYRHTAEIVAGKMYILGGSDNGEDIADTAGAALGVHVLDLQTMEWSHPEISGGSPFPRSGHASAVIGAHSIVIFGGKLTEEVFLNDLIIFDTKALTYTTVNVIETAVPTPIANASMITVGNKCFVFGGIDANGQCYNDIRSLDVSDYLDEYDITVGEGASSDYSFKILIIGDSSVGKSAILTRFAENTFLQNYTSTIGIDFNSKMIRVNKSICKLEIWDTAGQERFSTITANYYRGAQGALIVYDVSHRESFEHARSWFERAKQLGGEDIVAVLVGNKCDVDVFTRQVSTEEGNQLAAELEIPFIETSALNGTNVEQAFVKMSARIKQGVDARGVTGVAPQNLQKASNVRLAKQDRQMGMMEKCGCS